MNNVSDDFNATLKRQTKIFEEEFCVFRLSALYATESRGPSVGVHLFKNADDDCKYRMPGFLPANSQRGFLLIAL